MGNKPLVSVVLPTYDDAKYIESAVESILSQTFKNFELIVVNDGSKDQTLSILERMAAQDSRMVVVTQKNAGIVVALNCGLRRARGKYIARMDGDDLSLPTRLERQFGYLERNPEVVALGSCFSFIDENSKVIKYEYRNYRVARSNLYGPQPHSTWICHPASMIRKSALIKVGGYRHFAHAEDSDLWLRLEEIGELRNHPEELFQWRRHTDRVTVKHVFVQKRWHALALIFARRRREGGQEVDLTECKDLDEVIDQLTDYERARYQALVALLLYEFEIYLGDRAGDAEAIQEFIDSYEGNLAAGLAFLPDSAKPKKVRAYPIRRVQGYISGKEVKHVRLSRARKFYLEQFVLAKNNSLKKVKAITDSKLEAVKSAGVLKLTQAYSETAMDEAPTAKLIDDYASKSKWGQAPINGVSMLQQTVNILPDLGIVFTECSKNACTTIKKGLMLHDHLSRGCLPQLNNIHYKKNTTFLGVDDVSKKVFGRVMADPEIFRFCVSRNPYERLVSAYLDKVAGLWSLQGNSKREYLTLSRQIVASTRNWYNCLDQELQARPIGFAEFVEFLSKQSPYEHDRHWLSQYTTMRPDLFSYSSVVRFENFNRDIIAICDRYNFPEYTREALVQKRNEGRSSVAWKSLYTEGLAATVFSIYKADFEAFDYSKNSWK